MNKFLYVIIAILFIIKANAQNVDIVTAFPNANTALEITSTTKGMLPPRMTSIQRDGISSPIPPGLVIYNISINAFQCFNGSAWYATIHYIGESYGGGIVFYVYNNGQHGLIAATTDANGSASLRWGSINNNNTYAYAGRTIGGTGIGAGKSNTNLIVAAQGYPGFTETYSWAARVCHEYKVTFGGVTYEDWYLPSLEELNVLYLQRGLVGLIGSFASVGYWSSCESDTYSTAFFQSFSGGTQGTSLKQTLYNVRAIRSF